MEAPISSDSEDGSDESLVLLPEDLDDEVDINIHFHCEHCIKLSKCTERPKIGWSCEIVPCRNGCGIKFHECKLDEHLLMCSHERVPCLNSESGCPHIVQRKHMSEHLPVCPASVVVCNAEWNRWALGARERERVSFGKESTSTYNPDDLDVALALHDQELVNEMVVCPRELRKVLCTGMTRRFPIMPIKMRGSRHSDGLQWWRRAKTRSQSATDDDEEGLTPGLSISVCTELLKGKNSFSVSTSHHTLVGKGVKSDDISALCCVHGIIKDLCIFCRDDPDEPAYKVGKVWRERMSLKTPGHIKWVQEPRVEKVRKKGLFGVYTYKPLDDSDEDESDEEQKVDRMNMIIDSEGRPTGKCLKIKTPPPVPLNLKGLSLEIILKHYSRHQVKPRSMYTFQCMQEMRRDEFSAHYQNIHSEIHEGLDGWLVHRCPLHLFGCPFSVNRLHPGKEDSDVVYCKMLKAFGIKPVIENEPQAQGFLGVPAMDGHLGHKVSKHYMASSVNISFLPFEILQYIASFLDGFSLNNLSLTCQLMRDVCYSLISERGLVVREWVRYADGDSVRWKQGAQKWFFSKTFERIRFWGFKDVEHIANHLRNCPFNNRQVARDKFTYATPSKFTEELQKKYTANRAYKL